MPKQLPRVSTCLNCGAKVDGEYCSSCGQEAEDRSVSVKLLMGDFISEVWGYDSKLFRTLRELVQRPGRLTKAYNAGKRASYLAPLKMFLVLNVLFFLTINRDSAISSEPTVTTPAPSGLRTVRKTGSGIGISVTDLPKTVDEYSRGQRSLPPNKRDNFLVNLAKKQAIKLNRDPSQFVRAFVENVPAAMFVLLPVFAVLLKLIYIRSGRLYAEHLIFALHTHSFVYLVQILTDVGFTLLPSIGGLIVFGGLVWTAIYLFKSMRAVYGQGKLKTFVKFCLLGFGYLVMLIFSLGVVAAYTFLRF